MGKSGKLIENENTWWHMVMVILEHGNDDDDDDNDDDDDDGDEVSRGPVSFSLLGGVGSRATSAFSQPHTDPLFFQKA